MDICISNKEIVIHINDVRMSQLVVYHDYVQKLY